MRHFLTVLILSLTLQSCVVLNATRHVENSECSLHKTEMKKTLVGTRYGKGYFSDNTEEYPNAKTKVCRGCVVPVWPVRRLVLVYHCEKCNMIKKKVLGEEEKH